MRLRAQKLPVSNRFVINFPRNPIQPSEWLLLRFFEPTITHSILFPDSCQTLGSPSKRQWEPSAGRPCSGWRVLSLQVSGLRCGYLRTREGLGLTSNSGFLPVLRVCYLDIRVPAAG